MNEVEQFVQDYTSEQRARIEFAWNDKHAKEFFDSNQHFRSEVVAFASSNPGRAPVQLIRDLFLEEAKWSCEAWCAPFTFAELGSLLLERGSVDYLDDFLTGFSANFDTFGACHGMSLDPVLSASLLRATESRLVSETDDRKRSLLESGKDLFQKLRAGTATAGWATVKPGTPVSSVRVVGKVELYFRRIKNSLGRLFR